MTYRPTRHAFVTISLLATLVACDGAPSSCSNLPLVGGAGQTCEEANVSAPEASSAQLTCDELDSAESWARQLTLHHLQPEAMREFARKVVRDAGPGIKLRKFAGEHYVTADALETLKAAASSHIDEGQRVVYQYRTVYEESSEIPTSSGNGPSKAVDPKRSYWRAVLISEEPVLSFDSLAAARPQIDDTTGEQLLRVEFNKSDAETLGELTRQNVGETFVLVHGDFVVSAPKVAEPIAGDTLAIFPPYGPAAKPTGFPGEVVRVGGAEAK